MAKFINQINVVNFSNGKFMHNKQNNTLIEVLPERAEVDLDGNVTYFFKNNDKEFSITGKDMALYATREAYEDGKEPIGILHIRIESKLRDTYGKHYFIGSTDDESDYLRMASFCIVDGVPTEVDTPLVGFTIDQNMFLTPVFAEGVNIQELYRSSDRALWYNQYKYTNENGEVVTQEGTRSFALLTDEQKKLVEKLKNVLYEMMKANITPAYSSERGKFYFVPADKAYLECNADGEEEFLIDQVPEDQTFSHTIWEFFEAPTVYKRETINQ